MRPLRYPDREMPALLRAVTVVALASACGTHSVPPPEPDAGVDAGTDAGPATDAGVDAGADSGPDSGPDAGADAGADAGFDGGIVGCRAEAPALLDELLRSAAAYYATSDTCPPRIGCSPDGGLATHCTVVAASSSSVPSSRPTMHDWSREAESFVTLGFAPSFPTYCQYSIRGSVGRCANAPDSNLYSFAAEGDLDGDGVTSLFVVTARSDSSNALVPGRTYEVSPEE